MHFPVYVVLPTSSGALSRREVERFIERTLAPHQYLERDRGRSDEPEVVQHGWWDWYKLGGSYALSSQEATERGWRDFFKPEPTIVSPVADLLEKWSVESAPVRIVSPDGMVHGGNAWSEEELARWVEQARTILERYREHLFAIVDCHK